MTQSELNRAIARATGESLSVISGMGFVPLSGPTYEREPRSIDWDKNDGSRRVAWQPRRKRAPLVV